MKEHAQEQAHKTTSSLINRNSGVAAVDVIVAVIAVVVVAGRLGAWTDWAVEHEGAHDEDEDAENENNRPNDVESTKTESRRQNQKDEARDYRQNSDTGWTKKE